MNYDDLTEKKGILDKYRPFPITLVRSLDDWFRIELTYTSNAIEGNTLTRHETALVVEKGLTVRGKSLVEHLEATHHAQALGWVKDKITQGFHEITEKDILQIHEIILKGIDDTIAGIYRHVPVRVSGSTVVFPNPAKVPQLMEEFCVWMKRNENTHPVELAAEAHYRFVTIHPFVDGNGRTARLLMNMLLMMAGYPPAIIRKQDRLAYITSLEKAQLGGAKDEYLRIISKAVDRSLAIYLKALQGKDDTQDISLKTLKIGELAKITGERNSTIRYWTKEGLLDVAEITSSGYQLYSQIMIEQIKEIQKLKAKRYTLKEIKEKLQKGSD